VVDLSPAKILVVLVVALVVLGPDKLPRMARQAGRLAKDFRKFRESVNSEVREAFGDPDTLSDLQNLSSLSNLPARGRAWVTSIATEPTSSTPAPPSTPPATAPAPPDGSLSGPMADGVSPGQPQDGGGPESDGGGFDSGLN
jgi:sec-independent protein translocase protein TatB